MMWFGGGEWGWAGTVVVSFWAVVIIAVVASIRRRAGSGPNYRSPAQFRAAARRGSAHRTLRSR